MRRILPVLVLWAAAAHSGAMAASTSWNFSFSGLSPAATSDAAFFPITSLTGTFTGTDLDGDGWLRQDELTRFSLRLADRDWLVVPPYEDGNCMTPFNCRKVGAFGFDLSTHALSFSGVSSSIFHEAVTATTGSTVEYWITGGFGLHSVAYWTPETTLTVTPVPEVGTVAMMLAGLTLGLVGVAAPAAGLTRRSALPRRRRSPP